MGVTLPQRRSVGVAVIVLLSATHLLGSGRGITNTSSSPYVRLRSVDINTVKWTQGFWAKRFEICRKAMIPGLKQALENPENAAYLDNFRVAASLKQGRHHGTDWGDGDCYKFLETLAHVYAVTKAPQLDRLMDQWIEIIAQAQESDGYISTNIQLNDEKQRWQNRHYHELYNHGHLLTAACIHHRATGKTNFLQIARRLADYLYTVFEPRPPELAHWGWNPSNIMGLVELYRTTREPKYLELAGIFVDMRGSAPGGSDQNQFRVPLREETEAVGHAVTAAYLYCGAADVYAETGEKALRKALDRIWDDVLLHKMSLTGAIGAIPRGRSVRGDDIHEAFGPTYFLPSRTSYNETCANIGNAMWNWRMLSVTGEAEYADVMELVLYNSMLSAVDIDGMNYFYCNPLEWDDNREGLHPRHHTPVRWSTHSCYCCPPSVARTIAKLHGWVYSISDRGVWVNLYGGSTLETGLQDGSRVCLHQETKYPWEGHVKITLQESPDQEFAIMLRIPGWADKASVSVNDKTIDRPIRPGTYLELSRRWQAGDIIRLEIPMSVRLLVAHPQVQGLRGKVAVMRGPIVYCAEFLKAQDGQRIWQEGIFLTRGTQFRPVFKKDFLGGLVALEGKALTLKGHEQFLHLNPDRSLSQDNIDWTKRLYGPLVPAQNFRFPDTEVTNISLVPYYAWANRGEAYMTVWLPLAGHYALNTP